MQAKKLKLKHDDFLNFVIKDMLADLRVESSISLEFVHQSEKDSFISQVEIEIEEVGEPFLNAYVL